MSDAVAKTVKVEPTKSFFIDMLTRDLPLDQAVLDLIDNSIDGAIRSTTNFGKTFDDLYVKVDIDGEAFRIVDNCGGFSRETAIEYAFRFGRPAGHEPTPGSIGQFGIGMKRAVFKMGRRFFVQSAVTDPPEEWAVEVDVDDWQKNKEWTFPLVTPNPDSPASVANPGTDLLVTQLRPEVRASFRTEAFEKKILESVRSTHQTFVAQGLSITINGRAVPPSNVELLVGEHVKPALLMYDENDGGSPVQVRILAGLGRSTPRSAGWYVVCNGRVVLEADRRRETGWGVVEEASNQVTVPSFHNQFARFRGIVTFRSDDSSRVPWNTTKTDVDQDSPVWRTALSRMTTQMRPVIDFLNLLDKDIEENTIEGSSLNHILDQSRAVRAELIEGEGPAIFPEPGEVAQALRTTKIQYSRPLDDVEVLQEALGVRSAKAVGERTFDLVLARQSR